MTNREVLDRFIDYLLSERRYSPLTVRNYRHDVEQFLAWGEASTAEGRFSLLEAQTADVREWIMHLSGGRTMNNASINRTVASVRSMYKFLCRTGLLERDIFAAVGSLRTAQRLPKFVPSGQMIAVVDTVLEYLRSDDWRRRRDALMVLLLYSCGLRLAELTGINIDDFDAGFQTLKVRGKGDKERIVPLVARVGREVKCFAEKNSQQKICISSENALFLSKQGSRISRSDVQRSVARLLRECGVAGKTSPHVLRHTFATQLLNDGADLREIQELMGHASLRATQVYAHNDIASLMRVYADAHPRAKGEDSDRL